MSMKNSQMSKIIKIIIIIIINFLKSEKRDECLDLVRELKKTMEHEGDSDTNCNWCTWNNP